MKQVSSGLDLIMFVSCSRRRLVIVSGVWECWCFTGQSQLPRGEAALRVFAQQVGPHQEANSRFWPAQGPGMVLTAQHTPSRISIENSMLNQEGVSNWLLLKNPFSHCLHTTLPPTTPTSLFSFPASFLPPFLVLFHWLHYCLRLWKSLDCTFCL